MGRQASPVACREPSEPRDAQPWLDIHCSATEKLGQEPTPIDVDLSDFELQELWEVLFGLVPEDDDVERWMQSTFTFVGDSELSEGASLPCPWGLRQEHGGPCGVYAAVQAQLLRELLWEASSCLPRPDPMQRSPSAASTAASTASDCASDGDRSLPQTPRADEAEPSVAAKLAELFRAANQQEVLARAMVRMLSTAAPGAGYVWCSVLHRGSASRRDFLSGEALVDWLVHGRGMEASPAPVVSLVCSLLLTRGLSEVKADLDDPSAPLISLFGHCSQELTNLCLTGRAVTNIFDGDLSFEDGEDVLKLKGINGFPDVGLLSALEPLKLCEVGSFYKNPRFPLWVVGSATHYTLLFSGSRSAAAQEDEAKGQEPELELLHFNGKDFGGEKPALVPVQLKRAAEAQSCADVLVSDQDSRLFAEVLRCRWRGAEVAYPGFAGGAAEGAPPCIN